jgi:hypothetical protein
MSKKEQKQRLTVFLKAGLPYTIIGMALIFSGIYLIKFIFADSEYLTAILFLWLAVFWFVYQPLFRRRIMQIRK